MRKIAFIPALLILGVVACSDGGSKSEDTNTAAADTATKTTTDTMHHMTAENTEIAPVPEIPKDAKVYFVNLKTGQKVKSPFKVEMGVSGIALDSAGTLRPASGHHHILVDAGDSLAIGTVV